MLPIALAADSNFFPGLRLAVASILRHTSRYGIHFHILDGGLTPEERTQLDALAQSARNGAEIHFHPVNTSRFGGFRQMHGNTLTYARLLLPSLLPDLDEILYCDADVLYGADLAGFWEIPLQGKSTAVVHDPLVKILGNDCDWIPDSSPEFLAPYFNAGVLKINLAYWRTHQISEKALAMGKSNPEKYQFWDQSILNILLQNSVVWAPPQFNCMISPEGQIDAGTEPCEGKNLHFISTTKPWARYSTRRSFRYWRTQHKELLSSSSIQTTSIRYWAAFIWGEWILKSPLKIPICRFILRIRLYRLLPSVTESKLRSHLGSPPSPE